VGQSRQGLAGGVIEQGFKGGCPDVDLGFGVVFQVIWGQVLVESNVPGGSGLLYAKADHQIAAPDSSQETSFEINVRQPLSLCLVDIHWDEVGHVFVQCGSGRIEKAPIILKI